MWRHQTCTLVVLLPMGSKLHPQKICERRTYPKCWQGKTYARNHLRLGRMDSHIWTAFEGLFFFFLTILFIYFYIFICAGSSLPCKLFSSCSERGFPLQWLLLLWSTGLRAEAQELRDSGLVALQHVGSSQIRDQVDSLPPSHQGNPLRDS